MGDRSFDLIASNADGPVTWSASGLPVGVTLDANTGKISISSSAIFYQPAREYILRVTATDSKGSVTRDISFDYYGAVFINNYQMQVAYHGEAIEPLQLTSNGKGPFSYSVVSGDSYGLTISPTGLMSGTPIILASVGDLAQMFLFVKVTDANGYSSENELRLTIVRPLTVVDANLNSTYRVGQTLNSYFDTNGGFWYNGCSLKTTKISGDLPPGIVGSHTANPNWMRYDLNGTFTQPYNGSVTYEFEDCFGYKVQKTAHFQIVP